MIFFITDSLLITIERNIQKAEKLDRVGLMKHNEKGTKNKNILTMCYTYNPNNPDIRPIIKHNFNMLYSSPNMKQALVNTKLIFAKRQGKNLKQLLTSAKLNKENDNFYVKKCGKSCITCEYLTEGKSVTFTSTNKEFMIKHNFTCHTKNLIYVITCANCKKQYIGETGNELRTRMNIHRQQIRQAHLTQLLVSKHIFECGNSNFNVFPFYKLNTNNAIERQVKENYFINLQTSII